MLIMPKKEKKKTRPYQKVQNLEKRKKINPDNDQTLAKDKNGLTASLIITKRRRIEKKSVALYYKS